jgi:DNA modification methylase
MADALLDPRRDQRLTRNGESNKLSQEDRAAHDWYRFVLSFPPHLVREYLQRFGVTPRQRVLDPFCGTGTTLVECKKLGVPSVGVEQNPMPALASRVKLDWCPDPDALLEHAASVVDAACSELAAQGLADWPWFSSDGENLSRSLKTLKPEELELLLTDSISPLPLHKALVLRDCLAHLQDERFHGHELLAFAGAVVSCSNLQFGPEVGVGPPKADAAVVSSWQANIRAVAEDLRQLHPLSNVPATVYRADSRQLAAVLPACSIDAVITSPPYPNEKEYTRTTRLESVLLGFIRSRSDLRALKRGLVRSNTRGVYKDDDDDAWVAEHPEVQRIASAIEARRMQLGKTSGFERQYHRVARLYFGGMARHLAELRAVLRPGAHLAYVVGDQASYLRVMIRTGQLLADIAQSLGYELVGIDLFRTRLATATREQLREEVVVLRWPGWIQTR